jgi:class 3 adenylate cyclase/tetratricopeptide (TPR) repeat protein
VIFADVVGSTALGERVDPETLRWAMQRWFGHMSEAIERHGGTVENYIGDAVMAVFGIPIAHEDDALRAVRAAAEMREAVSALRHELRRERGVELAVRIGVNTGEAVTGVAAAGGFFTAGDTVNVGARLEQSARPGDILLGRQTFLLVRHAVEAEPVAPLTVKGKTAAVEAFRLVAVTPDAPARAQRLQAPMVDREHERGQLVDAFERAVAGRTCQLLSILGPAGVGKSRLVSELVDSLQGAATVAAGSCLPYGDGLTSWPLVEALGASGLFEQVAGDDDPAIARAAALLKPVGEPIAPEEAFWAMRKVLEALARRRPLVLVVDDLHWAEPTFLGFLEHVAVWARDVPLLLLVTARPDLLDARPEWGNGRPNVTSVRLDPLADAHAADLLGQLLGTARLDGQAVARILDVAEGYPLFVVEVVAMLADDGMLRDGDASEGGGLTAIAVPPTIQTLLAARIDRLAPIERAVIEAASIQGKEFTRERVARLVAEGIAESLDAQLDALVRKELIGRERPGEDTFRFSHQLLRDAAYEGMSKELRAELHERFADGLQAASGVVVDEVLGYHFERAVLLRRELGESEAATAQLAARASASLSAAGRRAAQRSDPSAASALLERALAVASDDTARDALLPALGASLFEAGRVAEAVRVLDRAMAGATDPVAEVRARVEREFIRLEIEPSMGTEHALRVADDVLGVLEHAGDDYGQCRVWSLRAQAAWLVGQAGRADAAWREAADCARRAGDERELFGILGWRATAAALGPTRVDDAIRCCEEFRDLVGASPVVVALMVNPLATLHAMRGESELADRYLQQANETLHQLGSQGWVSHHEALVGLLQDKPARAERSLRTGADTLTAVRDRAMLATTTAMLAQALYAQGRVREADECCGRAADAGAPDDIVTQVIWRSVKAKILAHDRRCEQAQALAREAIALIEPTDLLSHRADAMLDLAEVLATCGHTDERERAVHAGLSLYEQKGNAIGAARARPLLVDRLGDR